MTHTFATPPRTAAAVRAAVEQTLAAWPRGPGAPKELPPPATLTELKRAKAKVIGQKKIARQDLGSYAMTTALDELYDLGYQHADLEDARYEAVTVEDTRQVAQQYLRPDALVIAVIEPQAQVQAS